MKTSRLSLPKKLFRTKYIEIFQARESFTKLGLEPIFLKVTSFQDVWGSKCPEWNKKTYMRGVQVNYAI